MLSRSASPPNRRRQFIKILLNSYDFKINSIHFSTFKYFLCWSAVIKTTDCSLLLSAINMFYYFLFIWKSVSSFFGQSLICLIFCLRKNIFFFFWSIKIDNNDHTIIFGLEHPFDKFNDFEHKNQSFSSYFYFMF